MSSFAAAALVIGLLALVGGPILWLIFRSGVPTPAERAAETREFERRLLNPDFAALERALGRPLPARRSGGAAGVMMIPIPARGILDAVTGVDAARRVPRIVDVVVAAEVGELLVPAPEGGAYPGFIFARADTPETVETALRSACERLQFALRAEIPVEEYSASCDSPQRSAR